MRAGPDGATWPTDGSSCKASTAEGSGRFFGLTQVHRTLNLQLLWGLRASASPLAPGCCPWEKASSLVEIQVKCPSSPLTPELFSLVPEGAVQTSRSYLQLAKEAPWLPLPCTELGDFSPWLAFFTSLARKPSASPRLHLGFRPGEEPLRGWGPRWGALAGAGSLLSESFWD